VAGSLNLEGSGKSLGVIARSTVTRVPWIVGICEFVQALRLDLNTTENHLLEFDLKRMGNTKSNELRISAKK